MNEDNVKKRAWVKNAVIIFLTVLFLLTLFSNTIMNRSLPEVAAQYTSPGTITPRFRRTVTVEANENFELLAEQTRLVLETHARRDREIFAGDILLILDEAESEEVEKLRQELDTAREDLQKQLLEYEIAVLTAGKEGGFITEERAIRDARSTLDLAEAELAEMPYSESNIEAAKAAVTAAETAVTAAETTVITAEAAVTSAQRRVSDAKTRVAVAKEAEVAAQDEVEAKNKEYQDALAERIPHVEPDTSAINSALRTVQNAIAAKNNEITIAAYQYEQANKKFEYDASIETAKNDPNVETDDWGLEGEPEWEASRVAYWNGIGAQRRTAALAAYAVTLPETDPGRIAYETMRDLNNELAELRAEEDKLLNDRADAQSKDNTSEYERRERRIRSAKAALDKAETDSRNAARARQRAENDLLGFEETLADAEKGVANAEKNVSETKTKVTEAEAKLETEEKHKADWRAAGLEADKLRVSLEDLLFDLDFTKHDAGIDDEVESLNMSESRRQISRKRDEINKVQNEIGKLTQDSISAEITSPVNGIVKEILSAGSKTEPGKPMVIIEVPDRGYTVSFSVSLEEAKLIAVGDTAEVSQGWWGGGNVRAEVSSIRNDPQNPAASRVVEVDLSGEVQSGQQLTLTFGQRCQQYEIIVPNSAMRSDSNGDFVLVVVARSSPLGNRYVATRADVTILAQDDKNTAVTGGLVGWDYVITTSTRPLEPGMQVRFAD